MYDGKRVENAHTLLIKAKETADGINSLVEVYIEKEQADEFIYYLVNEGGYLASQKETNGSRALQNRCGYI